MSTNPEQKKLKLNGPLKLSKQKKIKIAQAACKYIIH